MEHGSTMGSCPFKGYDEEDVVRSTNVRYREKVAKINERSPAANLYAVDEDAPWFWPDENLQDTIAIRKKRYNDEPHVVLHTGNNDPAIRAAAQQLLEEQVQYLVTYFPDLYAREVDDNGHEVIINKATDDRYKISPDESDLHPLAISGLLGQEDICLVQHMDDGREVLVAGFLASPTDWHLTQHIGRDMDGIHADIKGYLKPADDVGISRPLKDTVDKVFIRLRKSPGLKVARNNILTYEDPSQALLPGKQFDSKGEDVTEPGSQIFIRSEYETLTALSPEYAVFTIAPKVIPLSQFADSPRRHELIKFLEHRVSVGTKKLLAEKALSYLSR